jgi:hypothetical protein
VVHVVGLAIRQQQDQSIGLRPVSHPSSDMPEGGTDARVSAGPEGGNAPLHHVAQPLVERLDRLDLHALAAAGCEGVKSAGIAAVVETMREHQQRLLLHVEHAVVVHPSVGG